LAVQDETYRDIKMSGYNARDHIIGDKMYGGIMYGDVSY
jgi:hypothetical protein